MLKPIQARFGWLVMLTAVLCILSGRAWSQATRTWTHAADDGLWSTPGNWTGAAVPVQGDHVVFDGVTNANCTADAVTTHLGSITLDTGYTGTVTFNAKAVGGDMTLSVSGDIVVRQGHLVFTGDTTAINGGSAGNPFGIGYTLEAANIMVSNGASINSDGKGFGARLGPGGGGWDGSAGGSYGGLGGGASKACYGQAASPTALGSGGGAANGGKGGGALELDVGGTVRIDGTLSADGLKAGYNHSSGSGGSIWIRAATLEGAGMISASGGERDNRVSGGGGRIDISETVNHFSGEIRAWPGTRHADFAAEDAKTGTLRLPQSAGSGWTVETFIVTNVAMLGNDLALSNVTVRPGGTLYLEAQSNRWDYTFGTLTITGAPANAATAACLADLAAINPESGGTVASRHGRGLTLTANVITIHPWGSLNADGVGFARAAGPGSGGSHGGTTTRGTMTCYGAITEPTALGSGGGEANDHEPAGGALRLIAGAVTNNGVISANSMAATWNHYGASGGSVWLECGMLSGTGRVEALGGTSPNRQPGAGGRIALTLTGSHSDLAAVSNRFSALGRTSVTASGTLYFRDGNAPVGHGTLRAEGPGIVLDAAVRTQLPPSSDAWGAALRQTTLVITNQARVELTGDLRAGDLFLATNQPSTRLYLNGYTLRLSAIYHGDWGHADWVPYDGGRIEWARASLLIIR